MIKPKKIKMWPEKKTQNVPKIISLNYERMQIIHQNCDKTQ